MVRLEGCCRSQTPRAGTDMTAQIEAVDFFAFDNSYARLPDRFFARLPPTPVANGPFGPTSRLSPLENHVHGLTVCRASCRLGQACYHHHRSKKPVAFADLVEPASLLVVDAIVEELEEGVDYAAKRHPSSRTSAGRDL